MGDENDHDARTIHCGNLDMERITEELLYELFLQAGPLERASIPKDGDKNRSYGFITYKYQVSVPYALSVFSGTKLFNRELRLNSRGANKNNNSNNNVGFNQRPQSLAAMEPRPILSNAPPAHQFQMHNPFGSSALRAGNSNQHRGPDMKPRNSTTQQPANPMLSANPFSLDVPIDYQALLAQAQLLAGGMYMNNMGNDNNEPHKHQSKMMHRHENRSHNQNSNYGRNDRRNNDRRRDAEPTRRDRSRSRSRDRNDWVRNQGRESRRDRNQRGGDSNRRRNDRRN